MVKDNGRFEVGQLSGWLTEEQIAKLLKAGVTHVTYDADTYYFISEGKATKTNPNPVPTIVTVSLPPNRLPFGTGVQRAVQDYLTLIGDE